MAQVKPEMTKSQIIRDFITENPTLTISEVVAALGRKGIEVTKNHAYVVKGKMKSQKPGSHAPAPTPSANGATEDARANSKSAAIRSVLQQNRKMKAKEVVATLAEMGVEVNEGLVYFVKGRMKGTRGRRKKMGEPVAAAPAPPPAPAPAANGDAVKTILKIKGWAAEVGGMKKLQALLAALSD